MNLAKLRTDLQADEGRRTQAYPDPLTHGAPFTIGVGHAGVAEHATWAEEQVDATLDLDIQQAVRGLDRIAPWWRGLDAVRQNVLLNMCFNLGVSRLAGFHHLFAACAAADYQAAAEEMLTSNWAKQVPKRAARLAEEMRSGVWL